ncbi:MAG: hypothetical protein PHS77_07225 [Gallionellaceae bacterium]|nr:hypothetical protein [Gallionellaceae bacterium]
MPTSNRPASSAEPAVRTILAAMLWLSARHRECPTTDSRHALARQVYRLALHPDTRPDDLANGLRLAGMADGDIALWRNLAVAGGGSQPN